MKKIMAILSAFLLLATAVLATNLDAKTCTLANGDVAERGFDEFGYNRCAHQFVGTCLSWGMGKFSWTEEQATAYCGVYTNDKLVMKWNEEWDRGNAEGWTDPNGYEAYLNNEWNGKIPGGSGETEIVKIKWVGTCTDGSNLPEGSYCIWGQFAVLMDHYVGTDNLWLAHGIPSGYGAY